jgi:hypothetical protein
MAMAAMIDNEIVQPRLAARATGSRTRRRPRPIHLPPVLGPGVYRRVLV